MGGHMRNSISLALMALAVALPATADNYYLTISGLGGEDVYAQRFEGLATDIDTLLKKEPNATVITLSGNEATKDNIEAKLGEIAEKVGPEDTFILLLIGHGSYDMLDYKFNIPGHDITATELNSQLNRIKGKQVIVNATSASGGALPVLQAKNRVIVTATKSGTEKNATVFGRYWVEAFRDAAADADRDESLTALEAFNYAQRKVTEYYETQKRLATEHALIEDTGEGEGVRDASPDNNEGLMARRTTVLHLGSVADIINDPVKQELLKQKDDIQTAIDELQYRKAAFPERQYQQQMRQLLLELARIQAELDK